VHPKLDHQCFITNWPKKVGHPKFVLFRSRETSQTFPELGTFVLDAHNPDPQISISILQNIMLDLLILDKMDIRDISVLSLV